MVLRFNESEYTMVTRYNKRSLENLIVTLDGWKSQSLDSLENVESADYPNDERIDSLSERIASLETAIDSLCDIE